MSNSSPTDKSSNPAPLYHGAQNHCFGCGQANAAGLRLNFSVTDDRTVFCDATISDNYEGPPGCLHGGIIATLLDEAMSKANRAHGVTAMTRRIEVDYLKPVPSRMPVRIEGWVTKSEGRKHWTEARIQSVEGVDLARASALFIAVLTQT